MHMQEIKMKRISYIKMIEVENETH